MWGFIMPWCGQRIYYSKKKNFKIPTFEQVKDVLRLRGYVR